MSSDRYEVELMMSCGWNDLTSATQAEEGMKGVSVRTNFEI